MPMLQPEGYETHNGDDGRLTYCEKRFVLLKELGHLVIDTKDAFAENADDLVRHAVQRFARLGNGVCQSENLAAIFAGEVLFPFHQRKAFYERYQNGSMSSLEIAILFRIPQKVVEDFLSKDYHELCVNLYDL
jgi:Zn-dependent peptidase ImmA (M78 family)